MPENQRRAILLREWQGLTYREISAELGLSQAAVETLIFRARRSLAQGLEQHSQSSPWKKRARATANAGGALASLKVLLGGGGVTAAKITASALAIATAAMAATASTPAPKKSHHSAKPSTAGRALQKRKTARHTQVTAGAHVATTGITSERARAAARRPERGKPEPSAPATATAPSATAPEGSPPTEPAASTPQPEAKPTAPAPALTPAAPAPEKGKSKGKKEKPTKPDHGATPLTAPEPAAEPTPPAPTDAAWGEPDPDPQPTPPNQESKPDKGPKADKDHGRGNGKN
jgi:hypothetical protein